MRVVLPEPRKPVMMVIGMGAMLDDDDDDDELLNYGKEEIGQTAWKLREWPI